MISKKIIRGNSAGITAALAIGIAGFFAPGVAHASFATTFFDASQAYEKEEFEESAALFRALANDSKISPELFYNLGNAEYRTGNNGAAALAYRRALVLDPGHHEASQNLRFLRRSLGFTSSADHPAASFARFFPAALWGLILALGAWALVLPSAASFAFPGLARGPLHLVRALGLVAVFTAGTALLVRNNTLQRATDLAIVLPESLTAHSAPTLGTPPIITLPAGSEVTVLSERDDWIYAQISDELRGWLPTEKTAPLWPYNPALIP